VVSWESLRGIWQEAVAEFKADNNGGAVLLYRRALAVAEALLGPNHDVCAELRVSLGHTYMAMCAFPEAESMYMRGLQIIESNIQTHAAANSASSQADNTASSYKSARSAGEVSAHLSEKTAAAAALQSSDELTSQLTRALEGIAR
jgi:hypothetical protein